MRYDERMDGSLSGRRMRRDPDRDVRAARIKGVALLKTLSLNHERGIEKMDTGRQLGVIVYFI